MRKIKLLILATQAYGSSRMQKQLFKYTKYSCFFQHLNIMLSYINVVSLTCRIESLLELASIHL